MIDGGGSCDGCDDATGNGIACDGCDGCSVDMGSGIACVCVCSIRGEILDLTFGVTFGVTDVTCFCPVWVGSDLAGGSMMSEIALYRNNCALLSNIKRRVVMRMVRN